MTAKSNHKTTPAPPPAELESPDEEPVPTYELQADGRIEATEGEPGTTAPAGEPATPLEERLAASERQAQEYYERLLRLTAELENFKKRMMREKTDFMRYANENLVRDLLESVDNLERALGHETDEGNEALSDGIRMTLKLLLDTLQKHGVTPVPAKGELFDPNFHEAVANVASETVEHNHIIEEHQRGYLLHDRLLRPAMVTVSRR